MIKLFNNSFELTEPYNTKDMPYRRGINRITRTKIKRTCIVLMRLLLRLLNKDLTDRFCISSTNH